MSESTFGRYRLVRLLARGGMAEVYLAVLEGAAGFEKRLALKRILPNFTDLEEFTQLFKDEARISVTLNHSHIVQVFDFGTHNGEHYIAMEYIDGPDLEKLLVACRKLDHKLAVDALLYVAIRVAGALEYAHSRTDERGRPLNLIHRDVSPPNVLLSVQGEVKITDFGVARYAARLSKSRPGVVRGKYAYMSPEQLMGEDIDARSDIFSFGAVLYEMLTGVSPFLGATDYQTMEAVVTATPRPLTELRRDVPRDLARIVQRCLQRDREQRYQSAGELRRDLAELMFSRGVIDDPSLLLDELWILFPKQMRKRGSTSRPATRPPAVATPGAPRMRSGPGVQAANSWGHGPTRGPAVLGPGQARGDDDLYDDDDQTIPHIGNLDAVPTQPLDDIAPTQELAPPRKTQLTADFDERPLSPPSRPHVPLDPLGYESSHPRMQDEALDAPDPIDAASLRTTAAGQELVDEDDATAVMLGAAGDAPGRSGPAGRMVRDAPASPSHTGGAFDRSVQSRPGGAALDALRQSARSRGPAAPPAPADPTGLPSRGSGVADLPPITSPPRPPSDGPAEDSIHLAAPGAVTRPSASLVELEASMPGRTREPSLSFRLAEPIAPAVAAAPAGASQPASGPLGTRPAVRVVESRPDPEDRTPGSRVAELERPFVTGAGNTPVAPSRPADYASRPASHPPRRPATPRPSDVPATVDRVPAVSVPAAERPRRKPRPAPSRPPEPQNEGSPLLFAAIVALVAAALLWGLLKLLSPGGAPTPAAEAPAATARPTAAPARVVQDVALTLISDPPGALLTVDGAATGNAPQTLRLKSGSTVDVRAELPGYQTLRRRLRVEDDDAAVTLELPPAPTPAAASLGTVLLTSQPSGYVEIDGVLQRDLTPLRVELPAGRHRVVLRNDEVGWVEERSISVTAGETITLDLRR